MRIFFYFDYDVLETIEFSDILELDLKLKQYQKDSKIPKYIIVESDDETIIAKVKEYMWRPHLVYIKDKTVYGYGSYNRRIAVKILSIFNIYKWDELKYENSSN